MTRLDKYLCDSGILTGSEASRAVRSGRVAVNGVQMRDPSAKIDEKTASVTLDSKEIGWKKFRYIMLNKPTDTVSTTEDDPKSVSEAPASRVFADGYVPVRKHWTSTRRDFSS